jgi:hypothetical protein
MFEMVRFVTISAGSLPFKDANQSVIVDSRPIYVSSAKPSSLQKLWWMSKT